MANPAAEIRAAVVAKYPDAVVVQRTKNGIKHYIGPNKYVFTGTVGPLHYGVNQEIDTAWGPGVAPWSHQMVKADFNAYLKSVLTDGMVARYQDPVTGEYVELQPHALEYSNDLDQIQAIAMPQAVSAAVNDDTATWFNGYGPGRTFSWQAQTARLQKVLRLGAGSLPPVEQYIRDGGNPRLQLSMVFLKSSSAVKLFINGVEWDEKSNNQQFTATYVEWRAGTKVLWYFNLPKTWDSAGNEVLGLFHIKSQGGSLFLTHRIPLSWVESAARVWPIEVDVEVQVAASADDARRDYGGAPYWSITDNYNPVGLYTSPLTRHSSYMRFPGVAVGGGVTITVAYLILTATAGGQNGTAITIVKMENVGDAAQYSTEGDATGRSYTAGASWTPGVWSADVAYNSNSIVADVQAVVNLPGWASGQAMGAKWDDNGSGTGVYNRRHAYSYNQSTTKAPKIHIEYSTGPSGFGARVEKAPDGRLNARAIFHGR